jgi:hypothetical protein
MKENLRWTGVGSICSRSNTLDEVEASDRSTGREHAEGKRGRRPSFASLAFDIAGKAGDALRRGSAVNDKGDVTVFGRKVRL